MFLNEIGFQERGVFETKSRFLKCLPRQKRCNIVNSMFTNVVNDIHENSYNTQIDNGGTALLKTDNASFDEI